MVGAAVVAGETLLFAIVVVVVRGRAMVVVVVRGRAMVVVVCFAVDGNGRGAVVEVEIGFFRDVEVGGVVVVGASVTVVGGLLFSVVLEESRGVLAVGTKAGMLTATTRPSARVALISTVCWPGSRSLGTMIWDEKLPSVLTGILFKSRGVENNHT